MEERKEGIGMANSLAVEIREARASSGKSLAQVSREIGVSVVSLSYIENGKSIPRATTIGSLAKALGRQSSLGRWLALANEAKNQQRQ